MSSYDIVTAYQPIGPLHPIMASDLKLALISPDNNALKEAYRENERQHHAKSYDRETYLIERDRARERAHNDPEFFAEAIQHAVIDCSLMRRLPSQWKGLGLGPTIRFANIAFSHWKHQPAATTQLTYNRLLHAHINMIGNRAMMGPIGPLAFSALEPLLAPPSIAQDIQSDPTLYRQAIARLEYCSQYYLEKFPNFCGTEIGDTPFFRRGDFELLLILKRAIGDDSPTIAWQMLEAERKRRTQMRSILMAEVSSEFWSLIEALLDKPYTREQDKLTLPDRYSDATALDFSTRDRLLQELLTFRERANALGDYTIWKIASDNLDRNYTLSTDHVSGLINWLRAQKLH